MTILSTFGDPEAFERSWPGEGPEPLAADLDPTRTIREQDLDSIGQEAPTRIARNPSTDPAGADPATPSSLGSLPPEVLARLRALPLLGLGEGSEDLARRKILGEGGMGQVWLAQQHSLSRDVAIKQPKPGERRSAAIRALMHEGSILGGLAHPNVVPVYALAADADGEPFLVMKRIQGVPWKTLIRDSDHEYWGRHPMAAQDRLAHHLEIFGKVCSALAFAHSQGVLHRDIKPSNVMVGDYGEVYLLDWGLGLRFDPSRAAARMIDATQLEIRPVGTPAYLAPEMLLGDEAYLSARTDVYLLTGTLHEALTGRPPHTGKTVRDAVRSAFLSKPRDYSAEVPPALAEMCRRGMHLDPEERFADASAVLEALNTYLVHRTSLRLTGLARERMAPVEAWVAQLRDEADEGTRRSVGARLRDSAAAAQFGLMEALREWPGNPDAHLELERLKALMCGHEIDCEHVESATTLLETMADPDPALVERLAALRKRLQAREDEHASLVGLRDDLDFEADPRHRVRFFAALLALTVGLAVVIEVVFELVGLTDALVGEAIYDAAFLGLYAAALARKRRELLARRVHRQFFLLVGLILATDMVQRFASHQLGLSIEQSLILDLLTMSSLLAAGGLVIRPWIFGAAMLSATGCAVAIALPAAASTVSTLTSLMLLVLTVVMMARVLRTRPDPDPNDPVPTRVVG